MKHVMSLAVLVGASLVGLSAERDERWVRRRVEAMGKSDTEDWRRIPWSASLTGAAEQARREGRLMFLFSHEGNIDTGRC